MTSVRRDTDKIQLKLDFSNLLCLENQKVHERMLFESDKVYNAFYKFLYTYIFHVENVKIESRSLSVDWYYLFSLYNHNQKLADIYNRSVHVVKIRRQAYEHLTRYGKYGETISDILDRVFNDTIWPIYWTSRTQETWGIDQKKIKFY